MQVVNQNNFEEEVLKSTVPVILDFWSTWCPPCNAMMPVLDRLALELNGVAKICKVNHEENPELATSHNIMALPTFVFYKDGKQLEQRIVGMTTPAKLKEVLNV